jgi:hypothetical protein
MNVLMLKHYKLQLQQLVEPPDNNYMSNQHLTQTQKGLTVVETNFDHLFSTYI